MIDVLKRRDLSNKSMRCSSLTYCRMGALLSRAGYRNYNAELEVLSEEMKILESECRCIGFRRSRADLVFFTVLFINVMLVLMLCHFVKIDRLLNEYSTLFYITVLFPCLVLFIRFVYACYYGRKLYNRKKRLENLMRQRQEMLREVKEKAVYNVAKELLDRYDFTSEYLDGMAMNESPKNIRRRQLGNSPLSRSPLTNITRPNAVDTTPSNCPSTNGSISSLSSNEGANHTQNTPKSSDESVQIFSKLRHWWEQFMDFIVRDGPAERYALICVYCKGHNGMAMIEDFENLSFRCCYCSMLNKSRVELRRRKEIKSSSPSPTVLKRRQNPFIRETTDIL
ncbi:protein lunapark-A [Trichinella spiralis]|uniref:Endoplasmic reticulum junction formation protein lunapark n=1 Tax=Trichinella spiralis TaxID=6334 RepID=E5SS58_TRISP|nr:protein lunapark-A [Trichinella spiralis]KRY36328.1 Protein lunapark [Trichinella spiralis]